MAYLKQSTDDDENRAAQPGLSTGTGASPMTQGAQTGRAPTASPMQSQAQSSAMQGKGSNFTNLESFLTPTVAKENQAKVQNLGTTLQTNENTAYDKAAQPLRDASFTAVAGSARDEIDKLIPHPAVSNPTRPGEGRGQNVVEQPAPAAPAESPKSKLEAMLNQDYTGPMNVGFTAGASDDGKRLTNLGSANTAINALAPGAFVNNLPSAQYGSGASALDRAMIKSDGGTMEAIGNVAQDNKRFASTTGLESTMLANKAHQLSNDAKAARDAARVDLQGYANETQAAIDARVAARKYAETADKMTGTVRDPNTGKVVTDHGPTGEWVNGTGATRGNTATAQERGRLSQIADLLGMPDYAVQDGGAYASGYQSTRSADPGTIVAKPVSPPTEVNTKTGSSAPVETVASKKLATQGLTPEQMDRWRAFNDAGFTAAEAAEMARSNVPLPVRDVNRVGTITPKKAG